MRARPAVTQHLGVRGRGVTRGRTPTTSLRVPLRVLAPLLALAMWLALATLREVGRGDFLGAAFFTQPCLLALLPFVALAAPSRHFFLGLLYSILSRGHLGPYPSKDTLIGVGLPEVLQ